MSTVFLNIDHHINYSLYMHDLMYCFIVII